MPDRPRLVIAVTNSISTSLLRGQLAFARDKGYEVYFLCAGDETAREFCQREGATLLDVPMNREISPVADLISLIRIVSALRRVRPHIVNAGTPKAGLLVTLGAWIARVPCRIYTLRGLRMETASGPLRAILQFCERVAAACAHRVICVSGSLLDKALELRLFPASKGRVLGEGSSNGVNTDRFTRCEETDQRAAAVRAELGIPADATVIGFVGRIVRDKGVIELVEAWRGLREQYAGLHLLVVGPFEEGDPVPDETRQALETDARVHLAGHVSDMPAYYTAMNILAVPTYREGFPNVFLEAAAMELPAVGTQVSGCVDAVAQGVSGTLVPVRDAVSLEAALRAYLDDPELAATHARQGRERVLRSYRPELVWQNLLDEYASLLRSRGLDTPPEAER